MQDAAYCRAQALLLRERAAKASTPEHWLAYLNAAKSWDQEADRLSGEAVDEPEAETAEAAPTPAPAPAESKPVRNILSDL